MLQIPVLTDQNLKDYERNGFVIVRNAFNAENIAKIEQWTVELAELPEESGKQWVFHEQSKLNPDEKLICRIEKISPFHKGFAELGEALKKPMSQIMGEDAVMFKEKVNFKMSGGDGFTPHQDQQAGWGYYTDYFLSALVSIDEATIENGCLQIVAGHQHDGLYKEWEPLTEENMADMEFVHCPTSPGDMVIFDCYAPHSSDPNMSDKTRRLYYVTYNRASAGNHMEQYYADKYKNYPPDIDREKDKEYVFRV